ncbi:MAG: hypothetical protein JJ900_12070 [Rhodospirillales bacterium]|nr:hypothetical protein [Rhodospirillales bacterium]MBO6787579.1 hypothetical protein [Rhodospirillales bacterium]
MNDAGAALRRISTFLLVALLTACAGGTPPPESSSTAPPAPVSAPETAAVPPRAPAPAKPPEPTLDVPAAEDVIGWDSATLHRTFGPASLVRRDLGAEIWQYRTDDCVLFLFLYPTPKTSSESGPLRVDHLEVRENGVGVEPCLTSVVRNYVMRAS